MGSIYKITNTVNGKAYIGQTLYDAEKTRIHQHLNGGSRGSQLVKDAVAKYGKEVFVYEILHDGIIPEFLDGLECEAIVKFNTVAPHGYNLTAGGGNGSPSETTKRKISETKKGQIPWNKGKKGVQTAWNKGKKGSTPNWLGRKHTDESCRKMSEATKGQIPWNKGKKGVYTDEALRRMSNARENPERVAAREFFFSLPQEMPIAEKRKHLRQKFPEKSRVRIWKWCKKFDSEDVN
jgi:group I intron endonuclease